MHTWTKPAITILALAVMSQISRAQTPDEHMAKPMGKAKTYTGCIEAGASAGTYMLTHAMGDMSMEKDAMKKEHMAKDGMAPMSMAVSSTTVDLSKHVGHKVTVKATEAAMAPGMAKPDATAHADTMAKQSPALSITSVKMVAATCSM